MERHTLFADRPLAEFLEWVELVVDAINRALDRHRPERACASTSAGATTKGRTRSTSPLEEILAAAVSRRRRRARDLDGERPPRARVPLLRARSRFPTGWRSSPASSTRRATTSSTPRSSRIGSTRVAEAVGDPRRIIAGHRLWLRHLGRDRRRRRVRRLGEAPVAARRRGPGDDALALSLSRSSARACPAPRTRLRRAFRVSGPPAPHRPSTGAPDPRAPRSADRCVPSPTPR